MTNLDINVNARDRASGVLKNIRANLGGVVQVAAGLGVYASVEQGIRGTVEAIGSAYGAAREAREAQGQLNAVLESTQGAAGVAADEVDRLSRSLMRQSTVDDDVIKGGAALLLTFTNIKDNVFPQATQAALDMSVAMKSDLNSAVLLVGKSLNNPLTGMTALTRAGVQFSASTRQTIKDLVEQGRVTEAQQIILAELNKEFGGSAQAARDAQGPIAGLKNAYDDANEAAGQFLYGGLTLISDWVDDHGDDLANVWENVEPVLAALGKHAETHLGGIIGVAENVAEMVEGVVDVADNLIHGRWAEAWEDAQGVARNAAEGILNNFAALFGALPNIMIGAVEEGINGMLAGLEKLPDLRVSVLGRELFDTGNAIPGSVSLPRIPTTPFDAGGLFGDIASAGDKASAPTRRLATDIEDLGDAADNAGRTVYDAISEIRGAADALFGQPTREEIIAQGSLSNAERNLDRARNGLGGGPMRPAITGSIEFYEQQVNAARRVVDAYDDQNNAQRRALQLADETLLTEKEQNRAFADLIQATRDLTGPINDVADDLGLTLVKGVDDVLSANTDLAGQIRNDLIPALVDDLGGAVRDLATATRTAAQVAATPVPNSNGYNGGGGFDYEYSGIT